uniref:Reverse transcriptase domain-containing protein n=1 Tax=Strongyloides venezuelensis TaxID=75913 RepID=A0A0K0FHD5_STRVS
MILDRIVGKFEGVVIYIDDILLFTQNDISVHVQLIINVVKALISYGLIIRLSKCQFCRTKVSYLGFVIKPSGTSINIVATEPLRNRKFPRSKKELRSFLFAMNTYNRFSKNFALIAKPLTNMLSNKKSGKDFYIESDASMEEVGAQLYQLSSNNEKNPIAFMSRKLSAKSKVLPLGYLELRGLTTAFNADNSKYYPSMMIQETASFNVTVKYIEGDKNNFAGYLSRSSPSTKQFDVLDVYAAHPNRINAIFKSMKDISKDLLKELQRIGTEIKVENGDIYIKRVNGIKHRWVRYVSPEKEAETPVRFHEIGHWHPDKVIKTMKLQVYFQCMFTVIKNAYKEFLTCAKRNRKPEKKTEVIIVSTASYPFQQLAIDVSGPFTRTDNGNLFLLNSICVFSRFLVSVPMADTKAKTIIDVLRKRIFSIFNTSESIRVDNAHYFDCEEFTFAMSTEDVIINFSTPYYSKSNCLVGKSFATTQNLVSKLLLSIDKSTNMWDQVVDYVVRYYNASVHETLNKSPNFIIFLRDPHHLGWIESTDVKNYGEYVDIGLELMKTAYEIINQHRLRVRMKSKIEEDMKRNPPQLINA